MKNKDSYCVVGILLCVGNHYHFGAEELFVGNRLGDGSSLLAGDDYYILYQNSGYCHPDDGACLDLFHAPGGSDSGCSHFDVKYNLYHLLGLLHQAWMCDQVHHFDEGSKEAESHPEGRRKWKTYNLDGTRTHKGVEIGDLEAGHNQPRDILFQFGPFCAGMGSCN